MRNYDKYKDALADIIIQAYKTDKKNFYRKDFYHKDVAEESNTSDIKDISFEWLLSKWNDKEWENRIFFLLMTDVAIDKRKEDIELGICACQDINCDCCALSHNKNDLNCNRVLETWLKDEDENNSLSNAKAKECLKDLIKILAEQGYEYEITDNHLCIYW